MIEEWKDIEGFENIYQVSNFGRARSLKKNRIYLLKNNIDTHGYYYIIPYVNKKTYTHYKIHRLVALLFVDGYKPGLIVNHKDGNKLNNNATNLEWVTRSYNNKHAYDIGLKKKCISKECIKARIEKYGIKIKCIFIENKEEMYFNSIREAARYINGTDPGVKYSLINNTIYKHKYKFEKI